MICPICAESRFIQQLSCKDFTVSQQEFSILECGECGLWMTNPQPGPQEIAAYYKSGNYISHSNTNKGLINKLYHMVRYITLRQKLNLIQKYVLGGTILDIGCGTGKFLEVAKSHNWIINGLEPDEDARKVASHLLKEEIKHPEIIDSYSDSSFDVITMWHVLEHVQDLNGLLNTIAKKLKKKGIVLIAVPNHVSFDAEHYKEFWAGYDVPRHLWHFTPTTMERLLAKHNMDITSIKPMWFDSFYVGMLSEKYKKSRFPLVGFLYGFISNLYALLSPSPKCSSQIYIIRKR